MPNDPLTRRIAHANFAKGFRGGERQTQLLIEALSKTGRKQLLLVRKGSELGIRCRGIAGLEIIEISKPYALHVRVLRRVALLHAHETKALQFAFFASLIKKIPYIVTRRVDNPISSNRFNALLYEKAACCVGLSRAIAGEIKKVAPGARCEIIPSAFTGFTVDTQNVAAIKKRFEGKFLIGHVGALDDVHKGQSYLIEAFHKLAPGYSQMQLILLGRGADEAKLKALAADSRQITFEGFVDNVGDYLGALDLFVFPSLNEGLGSTLLDVMHAGVPVVATAVGGIVDLIEDGNNGVLIPPASSDAIADGIETLYHDPQRREALSKAALAGIERYSVASMQAAYEKIYHELESKK